MIRGEVWWVNFGPGMGGEIQKGRPAIIVSNNASNKHLNRVQVVPLTTKTDRLFSCEAYVMVRGKKCKVLGNQLMTASKLRLLNRVCRLSDSEINNVERAIAIQLGLSE